MWTDSVRILRVADELTNAITSGDVDTLTQIYAADAVVWHNTDELEQTRDELLAGLDSLHRAAAVRIDVIDRAPVSNGFVQTQRWTLTGHRGQTVRFPSAFWVTLDDQDRVVRLDEYIDGAALRALADLVTASLDAVFSPVSGA